MKNVFEDLCPRLLETFAIMSISTLCVEIVFSEMRSGAFRLSLIEDSHEQ